MMIQQLPSLRQQIRLERPLIHCITNHISINQCANGLLALGAKPIMAEHKDEVEDITGTARALMMNLGNISDTRMAAMERAGKSADRYGVPTILDVVGVGCSSLRLDFAHKLIKDRHPAILKGNESEIRALCGLPHHATGIDNGETGDFHDALYAAKLAAQRFNAVILLSGKDDIITDGRRSAAVANGVELMTYVTGTGCLQGAVAAAFLSVTDPFTAASAGAVMLGMAGEYAGALFQHHGSITGFGHGIIDGLFSIPDQRLLEQAKVRWL